MEVHRKRQREDAEMTYGPADFSDHRNKRIQCLPLRASPMLQKQQNLNYTTMINARIGQNDDTAISNSSMWQRAELSRQMAATEYADIATGRIPTPIQPTFADQLRGQKWSNSTPAAGRRGIVNMGHHQVGIADQPCAQCDAPPDSKWHTPQNNRRLPSPISESDDYMNQSPGHSATLQAMEHPNAMMDVDMPRLAISDDGDFDSDSPNHHRKGHTRSRHTVNTWTWQPGMKRSFSIGYRSDCDKCRDKVPGHFNHIIIS